ncbi:MAG: peptide-methionine (S)-S-oxide reductase MsrA [Proteobacteria bacterium]|nr:peptide-methionine (S)-S-oxide reductase MsrA [Pseudomonadota bacterium]
MIKQLITTVIFSFLTYSSWAASQEAVFAMGCFWCGESEFRDHNNNNLLPGILTLRVGYAGGITPNPHYEDHEGYKEAVKVIFDPAVISYDKLLDIFWHNVDPFDEAGQFCDKGSSYTAVIFYKDEVQKQLALKTKAQYEQKFNKEIVTQIIPYTTFYDAEEYHQNYKAKNSVRYHYYRWRCKRDERLKEIWFPLQK